MKKSNWLSKIALGTAQFGMDYGISNPDGKVKVDEVLKILNYSQKVGLSTFDTASAYGESEAVLGECFSKSLGFSNIQIVSKIIQGEESCESMLVSFKNSLAKLGASSLYALMAHKFDEFKSKNLRDFLLTLKKKKLVEKIGVSLYNLSDAKWLVDEEIHVDIVQIPLNIFDQRFVPVLSKLKNKNIEIHARSAFLQGLFFLNIDSLPEYFFSLKKKIRNIQIMAKSNKIPLEALLLNFPISFKEVDKVVFGVTRLEELEANISAFNFHAKVFDLIDININDWRVDNEQFLLPHLWSF